MRTIIPAAALRAGILAFGLAGALMAPAATSSASVTDAPGLALARQAAPVEDAAGQPEQRFADAPYGVDPVVTGPVSESFKQRRAALGCDQADWPTAPAGCYPD